MQDKFTQKSFRRSIATLTALSLGLSPIYSPVALSLMTSVQAQEESPFKDGVYETNSKIITHFEIQGDDLFFYYTEPSEDLGKDTFKVLFPKMLELATNHLSAEGQPVAAADLSDEDVQTARENFKDSSLIIQRVNDRNDLSEHYLQIINLSNALSENSDGSTSVFITGLADKFILFRLKQLDDQTIQDVNRLIEFKQVEVPAKSE